MVNDRIRSFHKIEKSRKRLFESLEGEELSHKEALEICRTAVDSFQENRRIFLEMDYYKKHGKILGNHPIFIDQVIAREVEELGINDLHNSLRNVRTYVSKEKRNLKNAKNDQSRLIIQEKLNRHLKKLKLLEERIARYEV